MEEPIFNGFDLKLPVAQCLGNCFDDVLLSVATMGNPIVEPVFLGESKVKAAKTTLKRQITRDERSYSDLIGVKQM